MTEQLEAGVRYLDFRIAHKADDPSMNLYFVHMVYTTVTVQVLSFVPIGVAIKLVLFLLFKRHYNLKMLAQGFLVSLFVSLM